MVNNILQLRCGLSILKLNTDENRWCKVELLYDDKIYQLGAEDRSIIIEKLKDALSKDNLTIIGKIDGISVAWVLSLSEKHSSIYIGIAGDERYLFFQNDDGCTFAKVILASDVCQEWIKLLEA